MKKEELKQKFEVSGKSARDFIRWSSERGARVHDSTVSRHLSGSQGITQPWVIAYDAFFNDKTHDLIDALRPLVGIYTLEAINGMVFARISVAEIQRARDIIEKYSEKKEDPF